jgi:glycosyltransferase involved in cell wall biosynthesis
VKAPELIVETMQFLHRLRPDVPLYLFGTYPRPIKLPQSASYIRLPRLDVARDIYSRSLLWFCASRNEGFYNPLLEAMACGCSVVSTNCGGPSDFIRSGENGFLVPVGDTNTLIQKILELIDNRDLRKKFTQSSNRVLDKFTWTNAINEFESALISIYNSSKIK